MNQNEFLTTLARVSGSYKWDYYTDNRLLGVRGNKTYNPVTAVAHSLGHGTFPTTKRGTLQAARKIGMTQNLANAVYSQSNRGHAQIVRGKMLNIFNLETV
jgi:hypothetical protein